jgi:hypothetical protein
MTLLIIFFPYCGHNAFSPLVIPAATESLGFATEETKTNNIFVTNRNAA